MAAALPPLRGVVSPCTGAPGSSCIAADEGRGPGRFLGTSAIALTADGDAYVAGIRARVVAITRDGIASELRSADGGCVVIGDGGLWAGGLAVTDSGALLFSEDRPVASAPDAGGAVRVLRDGVVSSIASQGTFKSPVGIAVRPDGSVVVADVDAQAIYSVSRDGVATVIAGVVGDAGAADGPAATARFTQPVGVAVSRDGATVFVVDQATCTVRSICGGVVSTLAGGAGEQGNADGEALLHARFRGPRGVAVAPDGAIWVADTGNNALRVLRGGFVSTLLDSAGAPLHIASPFSIVASADAVYVAHVGKQFFSKITLC